MRSLLRTLLAVALGSPLFALLGCREGTGPGPAVIIPQTTHVIPPGVLSAQLESVSPDSTTFVLKRGNVQIDSLRSGDVLVSEAGLGILRKVLGTSDSAGYLILRTTQASLTEAIEKGSASFTGAVSQQTAGMKVLYQAPGVRATEMARTGTAGFYLELRDLVLYDDDGDPDTKSDRILANGTIEVSPSFTFAVDIDHFELQNLTMSVTLSERASLHLSGGAGLPLFDVRKELLRVRSPRIVVFVGLVPVVITPVFSIDAGATGRLQVSVVTSVSQENTLTGGLSYQDGVWTPIANEQHSLSFEPPVLSAGAQLKGYVAPQLTFLLYGVVGPYVKVSLYLLLDADVTRTPWAALFGGIELGAGIRMKVLSVLIADYEVPVVIGVRVLLWESSSPPSCGPAAEWIQEQIDEIPGAWIQSLWIGDANNDQQNEVLVTTSTGLFLQYDHTGTGWARDTIASFPGRAVFVRDVGDADNDGKLEVLVDFRVEPVFGNQLAELRLYEYANGLWTYQTITQGAAGSYEGDIGDADGDGDKDIVVTGYNLSSILMFKFASGGYEESVIDNIPESSRPRSAIPAIGDAMNIGRPQVYVGTHTSGNIYAYRWDVTDGWVRTIVEEGTGYVAYPFVGDVDNSGRKSLMVSKFGGAWGLRQYTYSGSTWQSTPVESAERGTSMSLADINADGDKELVTVWGNSVYAYMRLANGTWSSTIVKAIDFDAFVLAVGDAQNKKDGCSSIAVGELYGGRVALLRRN